MKRTISLFLVLIMSFVMTCCGKAGGNQSKFFEPKNKTITALYDEDGVAYCPVMNANSVQIAGGSDYAYLSPDRTKLIYTTDSKLEYFDYDVVNNSLGTTKSISKNVYYFDDYGVVRDDGVWYYTSDDDYNYTLYRYSFYDDKELEVVGKEFGDSVSCFFADNTSSAAFRYDGKIYRLKYDSQEPEKISSYSDSSKVYFHYVSDDGSSVSWSEINDGEETVYMYEGQDREKIGYFDVGNEKKTHIYFNKNHSFGVVRNTLADTIYLYQPGKDSVKVRIGGAPITDLYFTKNTLLVNDTSETVDGIYMLVQTNSDKQTVYWIDCNGEREKVCDIKWRYWISNSNIFYIDEDDHLIKGKINADSITDEIKLANDVKYFIVSQDGQYVYYFSNFDDDSFSGDLYVIKNNDKEATKISSDVTECHVSYDGKTVFFIKDADLAGGSICGPLMRYNVGDDSPTKISSDVVVMSINSYATTFSTILFDDINKDSFTFQKYTGECDEGTYADWIYYNGNDTNTFAKDVIV